MSSAQDGTFSPRNLAILGGLLFFGLFLGEVVFPRQGGIFSQAEDARVDTMADVAMRIRPVVTLEDVLAKAVSITADVKKTPQQLYSGACLACHAAGVAGAPKLGDMAAWTARLANGPDALIESVIAGKGAMPANGGSSYSAEQIRDIVQYMLSESGL